MEANYPSFQLSQFRLEDFQPCIRQKLVLNLFQSERERRELRSVWKARKSRSAFIYI